MTQVHSREKNQELSTYQGTTAMIRKFQLFLSIFYHSLKFQVPGGCDYYLSLGCVLPWLYQDMEKKKLVLS